MVAYPVFRAALDSGNLERVIALAREMPPMKLSDALRVVLLMQDGDDDRYEAACVRWLGRFALEGRGVTLDDLLNAIDALDVLPTQSSRSMEQLQRLCVARGLAHRTAA